MIRLGCFFKIRHDSAKLAVRNTRGYATTGLYVQNVSRGGITGCCVGG